MQSYEPLQFWRAVLPLIWISYDSSSDKNVWITCIPPFSLIFSSRKTKSVPLPKELDMSVMVSGVTAWRILLSLVRLSCYSVKL